MSDVEILPAILAHSETEALAKYRAVASAAWIQIDCLDGRLVPNRSFYDADRWPTDGPFIELHVMGAQPEAVLEAWRGHPRLRRVLWQVEAAADHAALLRKMRSLGLEGGLALNPETPLDQALPFAAGLDALLLLGVPPGWSGQPFLPTTLAKIAAARQHLPNLPLEVDGGVDEGLLPALARLGVRRVALGSRIFDDPARTPAEALHHFETIVHHTRI